MSFPAYPVYKDSGVEWLGRVPNHWRVLRIGALFEEVVEDGRDDLPVLSVSIHDGVSDRELADHETDRTVTRSEDRAKYKAVAPGDLVYNMMRAWQGGFGTVAVMGQVSPAYVVARPKVELKTNFVELALRTAGAIEEMRRYSRGVTDFRLRLYWEEFKQICIALPPIDEAAGVLAALGGEMDKIDALVAEQERLIEVLKEKRQAVISRAVTEGLNPDAPMKPSGVEWLGAIPKRWTIVRLKFLALVQTGVAKGRDLSGATTIKVPYLRVANVQDGFLDLTEVSTIQIAIGELERYALRPGDVLMNEGGDFDKLGRGQVWQGEISPCIHQNHVFAVRPFGIDPEWLALVTTADCGRFFFMSNSKQSTNLASISSSNLMELPVCCPPHDERKAILLYVSNETAKLDALVTKSKAVIALLKERRAALISAAVTGKIDVRNLVQPTVEQAVAA